MPFLEDDYTRQLNNKGIGVKMGIKQDPITGKPTYMPIPYGGSGDAGEAPDTGVNNDPTAEDVAGMVGIAGALAMGPVGLAALGLSIATNPDVATVGQNTSLGKATSKGLAALGMQTNSTKGLTQALANPPGLTAEEAADPDTAAANGLAEAAGLSATDNAAAVADGTSPGAGIGGGGGMGAAGDSGGMAGGADSDAGGQGGGTSGPGGADGQGSAYAEGGFVDKPRDHLGRLKELMDEGLPRETAIQVLSNEVAGRGNERHDILLDKKPFRDVDRMNQYDRYKKDMYGHKYADGGFADRPHHPMPSSVKSALPPEETADQIPAQLSEGEFVMDAATVRHFGVAKLVKMQEVAHKAMAKKVDSVEQEAEPMEEEGYADGGLVGTLDAIIEQIYNQKYPAQPAAKPSFLQTEAEAVGADRSRIKPAQGGGEWKGKSREFLARDSFPTGPKEAPKAAPKASANFMIDRKMGKGKIPGDDQPRMAEGGLVTKEQTMADGGFVDPMQMDNGTTLPNGNPALHQKVDAQQGMQQQQMYPFLQYLMNTFTNAPKPNDNTTQKSNKSPVMTKGNIQNFADGGLVTQKKS